MSPLLLSLPDDLADWRGTADELAGKCNEILATVPSLAEDAGAANERLIRHYVQVGVLSAPEREGREALFGLRQVVEFLAARYLLKDGWPLAKAAEIVRGTDVAGLTELIPSERPRTRAEELVAQYRGRSGSAASRVPAAAPAAPSRSAARMPKVAAAESLELTSESAPASEPRPAVQRTMRLETPLSRAADISRRRVSLEENLIALGNADGRPDRARVVRLALTPWCHVHVDARVLGEMSEETPEILGAALTQALKEERLHKGK